MHPAIIEWWKARATSCGPVSCGPGGGPWSGAWSGEPRGGGGGGDQGDGDGDGGGFGVRRPLRFLAYKLQLDDHQVTELAKILGELKTERAQAEVDRRRSLSAFADALAGESFDEGRAGDAGRLRVESAERLREAVVTALRRMHVMLEPEQRERLAYLIRTGTLTV